MLFGDACKAIALREKILALNQTKKKENHCSLKALINLLDPGRFEI